MRYDPTCNRTQPVYLIGKLDKDVLKGIILFLRFLVVTLTDNLSKSTDLIIRSRAATSESQL